VLPTTRGVNQLLKPPGRERVNEARHTSKLLKIMLATDINKVGEDHVTVSGSDSSVTLDS
jgi:hypothetical protein